MRNNLEGGLVVVPNYSLYLVEEGYHLPCSDVLFLEELYESLGQVAVAALLTSEKSSFADCNLSLKGPIRIISLDCAGGNRSAVVKMINYLCVAAKGLMGVRKKNEYYIYFPGHSGVIFAVLCNLLRVPYGLYVRGEWASENWFLQRVHNVVIRNARYIFATGKSFSRVLWYTNKNVDQVAPMVKFTANDLYRKPTYELNESINALFVSRIEPKKGIFHLVESIAELRQQGVNITLSVVGGGEPDDVHQLRELISARGVSGCVTLVGHVKDARRMEELFREADLFVYPSYYNEGFPRVLYEAMMFGLPIVCTRLEGVLGMLEDRRNCLFVNKEDVSDISTKLQIVIMDKELRGHIGTYGFEDVKELLNRFNGITHASQVLGKSIMTTK